MVKGLSQMVDALSDLADQGLALPEDELPSFLRGHFLGRLPQFQRSSERIEA